MGTKFSHAQPEPLGVFVFNTIYVQKQKQKSRIAGICGGDHGLSMRLGYTIPSLPPNLRLDSRLDYADRVMVSCI